MTDPRDGAGRIVAALGPTNTGKTHRAIQRLLEHDSGMIGLPLRLLAREVYDRVTARVGEARVALVTGEEKRIPPRPSYWVCTTEAMPTDRAVDFVAVDEVQLAAHRERGHVFTDRLLHARGRRETWFLGAETMRGMVERLLPTAELRRFRRLSRLRYAEPRSLRSLPPRSAVVAFSADAVYELAERLRRLHGGVAVVLGVLSPRTRNAQVAMYQAGDVDTLVATDAIGMGLNLDIDHVAFASLRKFDGRAPRALTVDELAQIAGRAGRHVNDGTFGVLRGAGDIGWPAIHAVEGHRFRPVKELFWRSTELDLTSVDALVASLRRASTDPALRRVEQADDLGALLELASDPEVGARVEGPADVKLLWEVCQIPDFRKLLLRQHAALLREIFLQLTRGHGRLDEGWLDAQVRRVDDLTGGIDALTSRLSAVRTWTYVSHRAAWHDDPTAWQERTRAIEDALGDALHERLVERFVERAGGRGAAAGKARGRARAERRNAVDADGPFASLHRLLDAPEEVDGASAEPDLVERAIAAPHDAFAIDRGGVVRFDGVKLARLVGSPDLRAPGVAFLDAEPRSGGARQRLERRLVALGRDVVLEASGGTVLPSGDEPSLRGLVYRVDQGLGLVPRADVESLWKALGDEDRRRLRRAGVRHGARHVWVEGALGTLALERRATLVAVHRSERPPPGVPAEPTVDARRFPDPDVAERYGYGLLGGIALRVDLLERLIEDLIRARGDGRPSRLLEALDLTPAQAARLLASLGHRRDEAGVIHRAGRRRRRRRPRTG